MAIANNKNNDNHDERTDTRNKNRIAALTLLLETYYKRIEAITGGSKSTHDFQGTSMITHAYDMKEGMKTTEERLEDEREILRQMGEITE